MHEQVIKVVELNSEDLSTSQIIRKDNGSSSSPEPEKLQVEFITIGQYTDAQGQVYQIAQGDDARIVEIPYQEEQVEIQVDESIENGGVPDADNQQDKQFDEVGEESSLPQKSAGDGTCDVMDNEEDSSVTIAGVPVDPSANYVMITTNVTDPTT